MAAEARTVDITMDKLCCFSDVQPQWIGLPKPVRVTVLMDSPVTNWELNDRVDRGVSPNIIEQPLLLGLNIDEGETAPMDRGTQMLTRRNIVNRWTGWARWTHWACLSSRPRWGCG